MTAEFYTHRLIRSTRVCASTGHRRLIVTAGDPGFEITPVLRSNCVAFKAPAIIHESKLQVGCGESDIFVAGDVRLAKVAQIPVVLKASALESIRWKKRTNWYPGA